MPRTRRLSALLVLLLATSAAACNEPPNREMDLAQGAIDAARAAGAETYAAEEYAAAVEALENAREAVAERDYRLALSHAIHSRERAQNAAMMAADGKAAARSQAERLLADVTSALAVATVRLDTLQTGRTPKEALAPLEKAIASARTALDDAGKALASQDYLAAAARLRGVAETLQAAQAEVPGRASASGRRRAGRQG